MDLNIPPSQSNIHHYTTVQMMPYDPVNVIVVLMGTQTGRPGPWRTGPEQVNT